MHKVKTSVKIESLKRRPKRKEGKGTTHVFYSQPTFARFNLKRDYNITFSNCREGNIYLCCIPSFRIRVKRVVIIDIDSRNSYAVDIQSSVYLFGS
jgi:hypothetical protein